MEFRNLESIEELREVFPVMKELRDHLDEAEFLEIFRSARAQSGYALIGAFDEGRCLGLMGYRVLTDFVHGRHLYIDDLVVTGQRRSSGIGARLLARAREIAQENECKRMRLCTGIQNEQGKSFYERNGWELKAVVYKALA